MSFNCTKMSSSQVVEKQVIGMNYLVVEDKKVMFKRRKSKEIKKQFQTPLQRRLMAEKLSRTPISLQYFSSHVMINKERTLYQLPHMKRNSELDEIARNQSQLMASKGHVLSQLEQENSLRLRNLFPYSTEFAMNVSRGSNIRHIHENFMQSTEPRRNILNRELNVMGVGSSVDENRHSYCCQIFVGEQVPSK